MSDSDGREGAQGFWPPAVPHWVRTLGLNGWMLAGIAAAVYVIGWFVGSASSIMVPLIVAFVVGVIAYPMVEWLHKRKIPTSLGAVLVLLLLIVIAVGVVWIAVNGVIGQWSTIVAETQRGIESLKAGLASLGVQNVTVQTIWEQVTSSSSAATKSAASGVLSSVGSGFSSAFSLLFGLLIGAALLYYVLSDFPNIARFVNTHLGLPPELGEGVAQDAADALRGYFRGTTITGIVVAVAIGAGLAALGVPLVIPITLVTFLACYVPFFGSLLSSAFACLVAFGAKGPVTALAVLGIVLVAQNLLQTLVNARVMGTSLDLSALVVLVVTVLGGVFAGVLGAALAAPLLAMVLRGGKRIRAYSRPPETSRGTSGSSP